MPISHSHFPLLLRTVNSRTHSTTTRDKSAISGRRLHWLYVSLFSSCYGRANFGALGGVVWGLFAALCAVLQSSGSSCFVCCSLDITDQCSHISVPDSAATASQNTQGRLDGMAKASRLAMAKFIAGGVGLARSIRQEKGAQTQTFGSVYLPVGRGSCT